jgi:GT2 family glycosyltransferase
LAGTPIEGAETPHTHDLDVVLVCVHYGKPEETVRFVKAAVDQATRSQLTVVVVDNSPIAGQGVPTTVASLGNVRVLEPGRNLGYFGGAALALADYVQSNRQPNWLVISNPDIHFSSPTVIDDLVELHRGREPGVLAPSIRSTTTGRDQNPYMRKRPSRLRMQFYRLTFSTYPTNVLYESLHWIKGRVIRSGADPIRGSRSPEVIYAPHGSFVAIHRSYFDRGGTLDHGALLFGEEIYLAETAARYGLRVLYEPRLSLNHDEHATIGGPWNRSAARLRKEASRYLADTFF